MSSNTEEFTLVRERCHWGVLAIGVLPLIFVTPLTFAFYSVLRRLVTLGGQSQEVPAFALFFIAMPVLFCVLFIALLALAFLMTEYVLTNKRLNFRTGVFFSASGELRLEDVEAVFLIKPFLGRLLGYGTVVVTGRGGTPFPLRFMPRPDVFHTRLREALEAARTGRNLRPPSPAALSPTPRSATPSRSDPKHPGQREGSVPLEKAWEELNKPLPKPPQDDSRYMPKG